MLLVGGLNSRSWEACKFRWFAGHTVFAMLLLLSLILACSRASAQGTVVYQINSGGGASGTYTADNYYSGGDAYYTSGTIDTSGVTNPAPQAAYQTQRADFNQFSYDIPGLTASGSYRVRLHFAEVYWSIPGQRPFNVSINGTQVLTNFDAFTTAGAAFKAVVEEFNCTADANGHIAINFSSPDSKAPFVCAIEVITSTAQAPSTPNGLTATPGNQSVTLSWSASSGATSYNLYRSTAAGGEGTTPYQTGLTGTSYVDTGLTNGTKYYYKLTAVNAQGESGQSNEASATPGLVVYQINAGGAAVGTYSADTYYSGGDFYSVTTAIDTSGVTNPAPQGAYQTQRADLSSFSYDLPNLTANGSYKVRLHFAEIYWTTGGQRPFNVGINGTQVLTDFDPFNAAGGANKAVVREFDCTANASGHIVLNFSSPTNKAPFVSAIEVYAQTSSVAITGFAVSPSSQVGGQPVQATVTLSDVAPTGGYDVTLSCSNNNAVALGTNSPYVINATAFPTTITVPAGSTTFSVWLYTSTVNYPQTFNVTATHAANSSSASASLTLTPANLRVVDYLMPKTLHLVWESAPNSTYYTLVRSVMSGNPLVRSQSAIVTTLPYGTTSYNDAYDFVDGTKYLYELYATGANPPALADMIASNQRLSAEMVTPYAQAALDNQTVDSRLDLRFSAVHYKDYKFSNRIYRGGLFAGYAPNPDQSQVARSFLKFALSAPPANTSFRAGDIDLYFTGSNTNLTSQPFGIQTIANSDWTSPDMVWTQKPATTPGALTALKNLTWDKTNPLPQWLGWPLYFDIRAAALRAGTGGDARLSVQLGAQDETSAGWAYFAKKEYDPTLSPTVTHVWDWVVPILFFVSQTNQSGDSVTYEVTVIVNGLNPGEQATIALGYGRYSGTYGGDTRPAATPTTMTVTVTSLINTFNITLPAGVWQLPEYREFLPSYFTSATYNGVTVLPQDYP